MNLTAKLTAKFFSELNTTELYEILRARCRILIMEQRNIFPDVDGVDYQSLHCYFREGDTVTAYLRAYYDGEDREAVTLGRVLTLRHGEGTGRRLVEESIAAIRERMPCKKICLASQKQAAGFYEKLGFHVTSGEFLEEGVVHVSMELDL